MYNLFLTLHNLNRWLVLLAAVWAIIQMLRGASRGQGWSRADRQASMAYTTILDIQFLLGIILYIISPLVRAAIGDFGAAMGNTELRFFAVEHISIMLIAVVLAHVGSSMGRRSSAERPRHRAVAVLFVLSLLAILFAIPWDRPLLRGF